MGNEENGRPIAADTNIDNNDIQNTTGNTLLDVPAKAELMTTTSGMFRDMPITMIMGIRIREATVWEMKVAMVMAKQRIMK